MRSLTLRWGSLLAFGSLLGLACTGAPIDPTTSGDTEECELGSENCGCLDGGLCDPGLLCASRMCVPSTDMSEASTSPTDTDSTDTTDPTTSTSEGGECAPADGTINQMCANLDSSRPYCNQMGLCVDCTGLDSCGPELPVCDPESGQCVLCLPDDASACSEQTPVCDGATNSCVPCVAHDECGDGACNLFTGECLGGDSTIWVDSSDNDCSNAGGSEAEPFCTLSDAMVEVVDGGGDGTAVIRLLGGPYDSPVVIPEGRKIAIINPDAGDSYVSIVATGDSIVEVEAGATAILDGIAIVGNNEKAGLVSKNAFLWVDRSRIAGNTGVGLSAGVSSVVTRAVTFTGNLGGGVEANGNGSLVMENCFVTENGSTKLQQGAIQIDGGDVDVVYTTVVANQATIGFPSSFTCGAVGVATVRNSVLVGGGESTACADAEVVRSAVDNAMVGTTNFPVTPAAIGTYFTATDGVYRAKADTMLGEIGSWLADDPPTDFEGDPRPTERGSMDYAGADVP